MSARAELWRLGVVVLGVTAMLLGCRTASALVLVQEGEARAALVLPAEADPDEEQAAQEIVSHVREICGAELPIVDAGADLPEGTAPVYLGRAASPELETLIRRKGEDPGSFALVVAEDGASVRGLSAEGTLFGAYELLEQLGVRWFMPGKLGTVLPETDTLELAEQRTVQVPSFHGRWTGGPQQWRRRLRMGGPYFPPSHGVKLPAGYDFESHPEYYALRNGERRPSQLCVSNPEVIQGAIETTKAFFRAHPDAPWIGMGPNDGGGYCECENCRALDAGDWDPFAAHVSMTDRYVWFFNQILKGIEDEFPDKKICFYSYASYNRPPVKVKPDPRIVPAFAPITLCRVHGLGNPICPEKDKYYRWLIQEWGKILPDVYERGYWFNLADPGLLFPMVHRVRTQIPICHELGITGWRVEAVCHWASETPSLYIAAKLMWDHTADVDALMEDFYGKFFGPAAGPMREYYTLMDHRLRDADFHTGCSFDMPHLYTEPLRRQARALLDRAGALAGDGVYGERVELMRTAFDYTEAFIQMLERRAAHDWVGAKEALDRVDALREKLVAYDPPMVNPKLAPSYLRRFFRPCTEQGYERVTGGNTLVAALDDEWQFKIDPEGVGEALQWFSADLTGGNWQSIKTSTLSWSDQGLRYYKGDAWYRQRVAIPARFAGQRVMLWFGGVDERAKVWVNGQAVGEGSGTFRPFELDVTEAIRPGQQNVVVARVTNLRLNELGTGGIMAPVFFYAPAPGRGGEQ